MEVNEIEIPVPWGHIAAKAWGFQDNPMVLVFHGVMDNAGSFDRLIPLLPPAFCYICIDFPGHGKSSQLPPHLPIHSINFIMAYKLIALHFKREKYIILGHSYGGQIGFIFTQLYPEFVEKLILLDTVHLMPTHSGQFKQSLVDKFDYCIDLEEKLKKRKRPTYTYEEALTKLREQRFNGYISHEAAEALIERAVTPAEDGKYAFTLDQRMKHFFNPIHDFRYIIETVKKFPITCPILILLGRESELQQIYMKPVIKLYKKYPNIKVRRIDGHHDVHNNNPEIVAPHVYKFLLDQKAKL